MSQELSKYLKILRTKANQLSRIDINGKENKGFKSKFGLKLLFACLSVALVYAIQSGFSESFISFISSVLSILVGLFITALIFSFDKFYEPSGDEQINARIKLWDTQAYNYAKKFAYITGYTIILSIIVLLLLVISTLFYDLIHLNVFKLSFCKDCIIISDSNWLKLFFLSCFVIVQRFFVFYLLFRITYNTLYIVSSMVQYMTTKIDQKD